MYNLFWILYPNTNIIRVFRYKLCEYIDKIYIESPKIITIQSFHNIASWS